MTKLLEPNREYLCILMTPRLIDCRKNICQRGSKIIPVIVNLEVHRFVCNGIQDKLGMRGTISTVLSSM